MRLYYVLAIMMRRVLWATESNCGYARALDEITNKLACSYLLACVLEGLDLQQNLAVWCWHRDGDVSSFVVR